MFGTHVHARTHARTDKKHNASVRGAEASEQRRAGKEIGRWCQSRSEKHECGHATCDGLYVRLRRQQIVTMSSSTGEEEEESDHDKPLII